MTDFEMVQIKAVSAKTRLDNTNHLVAMCHEVYCRAIRMQSEAIKEYEEILKQFQVEQCCEEIIEYVNGKPREFV